jgi:hypothetical protein
MSRRSFRKEMMMMMKVIVTAAAFSLVVCAGASAFPTTKSQINASSSDLIQVGKKMTTLRPISWLPRISLGLTIAQLSARLGCSECSVKP